MGFLGSSPLYFFLLLFPFTLLFFLWKNNPAMITANAWVP